MMPKRLNQALPDDGSMTTYQIRATVQAKPITNKTNDMLRLTRLLSFITFRFYHILRKDSELGLQLQIDSRNHIA